MTLGRGSYEEKLPKRFSLLSPVAAPPICPHGENSATTGGPCKHFGIWQKGRQEGGKKGGGEGWGVLGRRRGRKVVPKSWL